VINGVVGISLLDSFNNDIKHNSCFSNDDYGILLSLSSHNTISNNIFSQGSYGIYLSRSDYNLIEMNNCSNSYAYGIRLGLSFENIINKNTLFNTSLYHLYLNSASYNIIKDNRFDQPVWGNGARIWNSHSNEFINNIINNAYYGFGTWYANSNIFRSNVFNCKYKCMVLSGSSNNVLEDNILSSDDGAVILLDQCYSFTLSKNVMSSSGLDISGYKEEYWMTHAIDSFNTVNGKPLYYWKNATGGTIPPNAGQVILANCERVIVENLNISDTYEGIQIGYSINNTLRGNVLSSNRRGITLFYSERNNIENNWLYNNTSGGLSLYNSPYNTINENNCSNNLYGITLSGSDGNEIKNNSCLRNEYGIHFQESSNNDVDNNECTYNDGEGIYLYYESKNNSLTNNTVDKNNLTGIYLHRSSDNSISFNSIDLNKIGMDLQYYSNSNIFTNNTISYNTVVGINISDSNYNLIYHNNIIDNYQQIIVENINHLNISIKEGNYWSDYSGYDNGVGGRVAGDGIGDTRLPHQDIDIYPFIYPWGWLLPDAPILYMEENLSSNGTYYLFWDEVERDPSYILEESPDGSFQSYEEVYNGTGTRTFVTNRGNGTYYYRVKANNYRGVGGASDILNITVDWPPDTPKGLNITVLPQGNSINISWLPNLEDTLEYELRYLWIPSPGVSAFYQTLAVIEHPHNFYNHSGLEDGMEYHYMIRAKDERGQYSEWSDPVVAIPMDTVVPLPPTELSISGVTNSSITLVWNASTSDDVVGYNIYRIKTAIPGIWGEPINGNTTITNVSYSDEGLDNNSMYFYVLTAVDEVPNESSHSQMIFGSTLLDPKKPPPADEDDEPKDSPEDDEDKEGMSNRDIGLLLIIALLNILVAIKLVLLVNRKKASQNQNENDDRLQSEVSYEEVSYETVEVEEEGIHPEDEIEGTEEGGWRRY